MAFVFKKKNSRLAESSLSYPKKKKRNPGAQNKNDPIPPTRQGAPCIVCLSVNGQ